jgi:hypothetical protein
MVLYSSQVSQQMYMSQLAMSQQFQNAQMLAMQMGTMPYMPQMPQMGVAGAMSNVGHGGIYGEQMASRMLSAGRMMSTVGGLGMGVLGAATGLPLDPFSAAMSLGRAGFASAGLAGGAVGAIGGALPFMAAGQIAGVYTGAFSGGMREQAATNSMLRQNFNHLGGQGALGRGFSQQQMGQIGGMLSAETMRSPFTSSQELNQLIQGGQEMGMFNAVRDVESFSRRFKTMLDGLRKIQRELGGTLSEALNFTRGAQQVGIFTTAGRTAFASEMRDTMSTTGMDQNQLMGLAATGSMMSRATGGVGRQGAVGALRTARQVGAAMSTGAISQELLSEATGGLTGQDAIQAFAAQSLQMADRFSRRAAGRYSLFALSNAQGTGLDQAQLARFRAGDLTVGGVMRDANRNVSGMGRARALNQEGRLRGAMMEEGGLSGQIGIARLLLGERALDAGDDTAQLVMQRRFGWSQATAQVWTGLMRNQSSIAQREDVDKYMGREQVARQRDIALNRSLEAIMANFSHGIQEAGGVNSVRRMGREFVTKVSSTMERAVNDLLGVQAQAMSSADRMAATRLGTGRGTAADVARFQGMNQLSTGRVDYAAMSTGNEFLHAMGMHTTGRTLNDLMQGRGIRGFNNMSRERQDTEIRAMQLAGQGGLSSPIDEGTASMMMGSPNRYEGIMAMAYTGGGRDAVYDALGRRGINANVVDAYASRTKFDLGENTWMQAPQGGGGIRRNLGNIAGAYMRGTIRGSLAGGIMAPLAGMATGAYDAYQAVVQATTTDRDRALSFIARGGHAGNIARDVLGMKRLGNSMGPNQRDRRMSHEEAVYVTNALQDPPDVQAVAKVIDSDTFQSDLRELRTLKGDAAEAKLNQMQRRGADMTPDERKAHGVIMNQLRLSGRIMGKYGGGSEWGVSAEERRKAEEYRSMMNSFGFKYSGIQAELGKDSAMGAAFGTAAAAFYSGDPAAIRAGTKALVGNLAGQSAEQRKGIDAILGKSDEGRSVLMEESRRSNLVRQITGKGRRGRAGAGDALLGELTANTLNQMDIKLDGDKQLTTRNRSNIIMDIFRKGGALADSVAAQMTKGLTSQGIEDAGTDVASIRDIAKHKGPISEKALNNLLDKMDTAGRDRVKTAANEAAMRANDPVGYESWQELKKISAALTTKPGEGGDGPMSKMPPSGPKP